MSREVSKPWGHEEVWAETPKYVGKVLHITEGHRLSLQHHEVKDETIMVLEGTLHLELADHHGNMHSHRLRPGMSARIAPGRKHRMHAITGVKVVEVSTPELQDVVRHDDDYGRF